MSSKYLRKASASILAGLLIFGSTGAGMTGLLAGSEGDKRFPPFLPNTQKAPCARAYKAYVAASGHSAYATTPYSRQRYLYIICGGSLNAPSQKAAEVAALKSCQATLGRHKVTTGGGCEIAASK